MIGERLIDLRKDNKITQQKLAEVLNINKHSISSYERDKNEPPDEIKIRIAKYFGVSMDFLLGISDNPNPYVEEDNYIRLPVRFTKEAKKELYSFIEYLKFKYKIK